MNPHQDKTVAIVDPVWIGHHPMYFARFTVSFLRMGTRVIALCPNPEDARDEILRAIDPSMRGQIGERVTFREIPHSERSMFGGKFEGDPIRTATRWSQLGNVIREAEQELGRLTDLVYFPYVDAYLRFLPFSVAPEILLGRKWAGLYLRNHHFAGLSSPKRLLVHLAKGDAILRSESCLGIGVLDERFIPMMEKFTGQAVTHFPDFTDTGLPPERSALSSGILAKADGRKIIGMIGLERRKGVLTLLRCAELALQRDLPYYFVCAGRIFPSEFSQEEWAWVQKLGTGDIPNLHFDPGAGRLPSEADFNSLFSTFDVAWAAYENFQGSSNTLAKAAAFGIPCLACESGCVGHRVKNHRIGLTIPEADHLRALEAIPLLLGMQDWNGRPLEPTYNEFKDQHSLGRLDTLLEELLSKA
jgi:glycosyltransferase involved in cell wall biosynthesis